MKNRVLAVCFAFSVLLNLVVGGLLVMTFGEHPAFTGDYKTENISLIARLHRANFLGSSLKREIEKQNDKDLPAIISELAQNPNPQAIVFGDRVMYIKMDSYSYNGLTREETKAVIAHEIGHYMLGHTPEPDINKEIEADMYALAYVDASALSEAIKKLSHYEDEKSIRLKAIEEH